MTFPSRLFAAAALALFGGSSATAQGPARASAAHPVVVELFQSQGCSSCPPANANVNAIATRPDVLALSFAVTYWDQLGWKDTFASPRNTARQWDYARAGGRGNVATPQVIVNGGTAIVGSNRQQLDATIARAGPPRGGPTLSIEGATLKVGAARSAPAAVWLVRYDPRAIDVPIKAGENGGRTLPHRNIVRDMVKLGDWTGPARSFTLAVGSRGLSSAIIVQRGRGGPIIAARRV
ncbi:DUF1223 domain-containing protein [Sphingomonas sp. SUN019]|uniref:DUF1223 domain-containing protein n=1 Tax=Sphingomonas sp. SUN019 TaxID=2937788 RepID=UPI002164EF96|nr:DUF1223 domain-containing protein [Sphingomonas sp. SUN019]UVO50806.1 DUF1223 domain-containing protein [Sphingomonas sp. SUN019]